MWAIRNDLVTFEHQSLILSGEEIGAVNWFSHLGSFSMKTLGISWSYFCHLSACLKPLFQAFSIINLRCDCYLTGCICIAHPCHICEREVCYGWKNTELVFIVTKIYRLKLNQKHPLLKYFDTCWSTDSDGGCGPRVCFFIVRQNVSGFTRPIPLRRNGKK